MKLCLSALKYKMTNLTSEKLQKGNLHWGWQQQKYMQKHNLKWPVLLVLLSSDSYSPRMGNSQYIIH